MQGSGSAEQPAGVEEDEAVKIMKQKILNNLFSLSTVVLHMAYTFQFKLQDNRGSRYVKITNTSTVLRHRTQVKLLFG